MHFLLASILLPLCATGDERAHDASHLPAEPLVARVYDLGGLERPKPASIDAVLLPWLEFHRLQRGLAIDELVDHYYEDLGDYYDSTGTRVSRPTRRPRASSCTARARRKSLPAWAVVRGAWPWPRTSRGIARTSGRWPSVFRSRRAECVLAAGGEQRLVLERALAVELTLLGTEHLPTGTSAGASLRPENRSAGMIAGTPRDDVLELSLPAPGTWVGHVVVRHQLGNRTSSRAGQELRLEIADTPEVQRFTIELDEITFERAAELAGQ